MTNEHWVPNHFVPVLPIDVVTVDINRLQEHVDMDVEKEVSVVGEDWIEREETGEKERTRKCLILLSKMCYGKDILVTCVQLSKLNSWVVSY
jgi:hypothetical protein